MRARTPRFAVVALIACALPAAMRAQVAVGDSLWKLGRTGEAAEAYQRELERDRFSVRANVLTARTLAWGSNIDSALVLLRNARVRVPDDPDIRYTEALYLSWNKKFDAAVVRFDSLLQTNPELDYVRVARARTLSWAGKLPEAEEAYRSALARPMKDADEIRDASIGLAQVSSWRGDLMASAKRYQALLAEDPGDPRALAGLGSVRTWQARPREAARLFERALQRDSANAETKTSLAEARIAAATRTDIEFDWSSDSDGDQNSWMLASNRMFVSDQLAATATFGFLAATGQDKHPNRALGELTLNGVSDWIRGSASLGVRALHADTSGTMAARDVLTARASATARLGAGANLGVSFARFPFDEIASLIPRAIDLTAFDLNLDVTPWTKGTVAASVGTLGISDGNRRTNFTLRAAQHWTNRPWVGVFARSMSFAETIRGYFSPSNFLLYEAQGGWEREGSEWSGNVSGGLGSQMVDTGKPWQSEYHAEGRIARRWKSGNALALTGGLSTSAASSAVGAFKYSTLGLSATIAW